MDDREVAALHVRIDWEYDRLYERLQKEELADAVQWGGFFRRSLAVLVDNVCAGRYEARPPHTIHPSSRALSFAAFQARA